ncbi:hypothetical protein FSP39_005332 [Pinctada imbricata]|uniref:SRCR domain-containing protein n=1 Tax=Pinctada imbricata TaxID=66713 RepID=A0AA89C6G7_PINIB|nr:hypothetical protein FSP39_005332 [Pinctada imbricata]
MVDQLLLKTFEEKNKLEIELSNLRRHVDHLHRDLVHLEKLFKSILIQSKKHMVRLVGGGFMSGRLEVKIDGEWGTVCDDYFGTDDANVVCKQLGYSSGVVRDQAYYGMGSLKILMDDVACLGSELAIQNCRYKREHDCSHSEDVGVICS